VVFNLLEDERKLKWLLRQIARLLLSKGFYFLELSHTLTAKHPDINSLSRVKDEAISILSG